MSKERNLQIFIAKLNPRVREKDLDYSFSKYGNIKNILIKSGYAFIEYDNYKDAERAVRHMDGKTLEGQKIVVEHAKGRKQERERNHSRGRDRSDSRGRRRRENSGERGRDRDRDRERRYNSDGYVKRRGPQADDICYNCGKTGHWSNECREPLKNRGQYFKEDNKCYKCGEKGHIQRNCKKSRSRSKSASRSRSRSRSRSDDRSRNGKKRSSRKRSESSKSRSSKSVSRSPSNEKKSEERKGDGNDARD